MKKISAFIVLFLACNICLMIAFNFFSFNTNAATDTVDLQINVQDYLSLSVSSGDSVDFGNFNPGTPVCSNTASVASVTTNAANGYTLGIHDGSGTNSALTKGGGVYIPDYAGSIATPTEWTGTGVGVSMWDADSNHEIKWCKGGTITDCTTVCDADNLYAGVPETATTAHTVTGYISGADTSSWSWKVDAPTSQETGSYSGTVTFTATAVVS